jgi:hypothetical protein
MTTETNKQLEIEDTLYFVPDRDLIRPEGMPSVQTEVTARRELLELSSVPSEPKPERGERFRHQEEVARLMRLYDSLLLVHETGTGKTCASLSYAEDSARGLEEHKADFISGFLSRYSNYVKHCYIVVPNNVLENEFKAQLAFACTPPGRYDTEAVRTARKESIMRSQITRNIKHFYTIITFQKFASSLAKISSDESIRERFKNSLIIIDEVHKLHTEETKKKEAPRPGAIKYPKTYDVIHDFIHMVSDVKFIFMTATPMVNKVEDLTPIINLMLPVSMQLPKEVTITSLGDDVRRYIQGRVSFVKSMKTCARPRYIGINVNPGQSNEELTTRTSQSSLVYPIYLSSFQLNRYRDIAASSQGFKQEELQALNFVFPDGSSGKGRKGNNPTAFNKYVKHDKGTVYHMEQDFKNQIPNIETLRVFSAKFATAIELVDNREGPSFIFDRFVDTGVILLSLMFMHLKGYTEFLTEGNVFRTDGTPAIIKMKRVAVISTNTPPTRKARILSLMRSDHNIDGEYIKVLIVSPTAATGISVNNVLTGILMNPSWNDATMYQAISRILRVVSHNAIIERKKRQGIQNPTVDIQLYRLCTFVVGAQPGFKTEPAQFTIPQQFLPYPSTQPYETITLTPTVDSHMYQTSQKKSLEIDGAMDILRSYAIDCQLQKVRNREMEGTEVIPCSDPSPDYIIEDSYRVLYSETSTFPIQKVIKDIFQNYDSLRVRDLYMMIRRELPYIVPEGRTGDYLIDTALQQMIDVQNPRPELAIHNRFGYQVYLREKEGIYFVRGDLAVDLSQIGVNERWLSYYDNILVGIQTGSYHDYHVKFQYENSQHLISAAEYILNQYGSNSQAFEKALKDLLFLPISRILETSLVKQYNNQSISAFEQAVMNRFSFYIFRMKKPVNRLEAAKKSTRMALSRLMKNIEEMNPGEGQDVIIHTLYTTERNSVMYAVPGHVLKAIGRYRIYDTQENEWSTLENDTVVHRIYQQIIRKMIYNEDLPQSPDYKMSRIYNSNQRVFGTIMIIDEIFDDNFNLTDDRFRIADLRFENQTLKNKPIQTSRVTGKMCSGWSANSLVDILFHLGVPPPANVFLSNLNRSYVLGKEDNEFKPMTNQQLGYFAAFKAAGMKTKDLCNMIRAELEHVGLMLYL